MTTDWGLAEVAEGYEDYVPIREQTLAWPVMFAELGVSGAGRTVLDYGSGTGRVAERMVRELGVSVIAADPSKSMLAVAQDKRPLPEISYQLIGDDQKLDYPDDAVDGAISCFVFVCIGDAERVQNIISEVYRLLRPGSTYAMLELNPDMVGVPFEMVQMGKPGRTYAAGEAMEVRLATPGSVPMDIIDYYWPRESHEGFLRTAGFENIRSQEPTLDPAYDGPLADQMQVERTHAPYTIYLAQKPL